MPRELDLTNFASIKRIIKIFAVRFTAAMFIPGRGTLFNKRNSLITFLLWYGAGQVHGLIAGKVIPPARHCVNAAHRTQVI